MSSVRNPMMTVNAQYETIAAGQTAQVLGTAGAKGDFIAGILIIPALAAAGLVTLLDGATSIPIYVGGAVTALPNLMPVYVRLNLFSANGAWSVTTGASVSCIAMGSFSV
jgi:hypothetical protein